MEAVGGIDLGCFGSFFIWKNGRYVVSHIRKWLDRLISSAAWCNSFPMMGIENLNILSSNHALILLDTCMERGHLFKPFHFFKAWSLDPSCREVIVKAWEKVVSDVESFTLRLGLGNSRSALRSWNRSHIGNCSIKLRDTEACVMRLQSIPYSPHSLQEEAEVQLEVTHLQEMVESMWKQKSRELLLL